MPLAPLRGELMPIAPGATTLQEARPRTNSSALPSSFGQSLLR